MEANAAAQAADALAKGAFDVLDVMFGLSTKLSAGAPAEAAPANVAEALAACPVVLQGKLKPGLGALALLLDAGFAGRIAALAQDQPPPAEAGPLSPVDRVVLNDIAESALGGGITGLTQRAGRPVEPPPAIEIVEAPDPAALIGFVGPGTLTPLQFTSGDVSGAAYVLHSAALEGLVAPAPAAPAAAGGPARAAMLSPAELGDILSGFGPDAVPPPPAPDNIEMVLDIRLTATARLGRIDMALSDVMALGPGSIIEVGQTVDEPVDLLINDKLIARGDVVVVDEKFGLRITEIVSTRERIESLR